MSFLTKHDDNSENSQLSLFNRLKLLVSNPKDAFALFSAAEAKQTAIVVFFSYFFIRFPFVLQKTYLEGKFENLGGWETAAFIAGGMAGGILVTLALFSLFAWIMKYFINKYKDLNVNIENTLCVLVLSLTPQLLLLFEWPFLLFDFQAVETMFSMLILRLVLDLFCLRVYYYGLKVVFNASKTNAFAVIILPTIIVIMMLIKLLIF